MSKAQPASSSPAGRARSKRPRSSLSLTVRRSVPIVLTAAMRPADSLSEDGSLNLVNAVRTAASAAARDLGVVVVMNDRIFAARDVTKGAGYRTDAFVSRDLGPLGYAEPDGTILIRHRHTQPSPTQSPFDASTLGSLPRVEVVVSYVGADGKLIDAAVSHGADGIVSAGFGAGKPTALEEAALDRAIGGRRRRRAGQPRRDGSRHPSRVPSVTRHRRIRRPPAVEGPDPPGAGPDHDQGPGSDPGALRPLLILPLQLHTIGCDCVPMLGR